METHDKARQGMPGATFRLAVGVFDGRQDLENALIDLQASGLTSRDICFAGKRSMLDTVLRPSSPNKELPTAQRPFSLRRLGIEGLSQEYVATSHGILRTLLDQAKPYKVSPAPSASFWPELCQKLAVHMQRNAVVLVVNAQDASLQSRSSRILLRHATHSVQTYEFIPQR